MSAKRHQVCAVVMKYAQTFEEVIAACQFTVHMVTCEIPTEISKTKIIIKVIFEFHPFLSPSRCKRISMLCDHDDYDCFRKPTSFSYNFISMVPNMTVPITGTGLFNLQTTVWSQNLEFDLKIDNIHSPPGVERASDHFFSLRKVPQGVTLQLLRPLDGPQDVELELTMNVFTQDRTPSGSSVAKIFILVSEFPF
jgi:hypothetical protein